MSRPGVQATKRCEVCGSRVFWKDDAGISHCAKHEPPTETGKQFFVVKSAASPVDGLRNEKGKAMDLGEKMAAIVRKLQSMPEDKARAILKSFEEGQDAQHPAVRAVKSMTVAPREVLQAPPGVFSGTRDFYGRAEKRKDADDDIEYERDFHGRRRRKHR